MAFSKSNRYPTDVHIVSEFMKALGHSARMKILEQLYKEGPMPLQVIHKSHPISQPAMSEHFRILRNHGLLLWQEKFPHTLYKVDRKNLAIAKQKIIEYLDQF